MIFFNAARFDKTKKARDDSLAFFNLASKLSRNIGVIFNAQARLFGGQFRMHD